MKVKVICRNPDHYLRETKNDLHKMQRNYDPDLHPLEAPREYKQALNAVKLERVFAKPFLCSLDGHRDGVCCMAKHPERLSIVASGAYNGEVIVWNLASRKQEVRMVAHERTVKGMTFEPSGEHLITCGDDKTIKIWKTERDDDEGEILPSNTIICKNSINSITHHREDKTFVTAGEAVELWDSTRDEPLRTFQWGVDPIHCVQFNQVQTNLIGACSSDRSIMIYDMRNAGPVRKVTMSLKANKICWNPMEAFHFTAASEDFNLYTFDCRNLSIPLTMHVGHTSAVIDVDYCPTGMEFVSGSYDKTIRIFESSKITSREIYHTKRMQRLTCVAYTYDSRYIISGSDEMNLRLWKAIAWQKHGVVKPRERAAMQYGDTLKEKFATHPQIKRISKHRQVPQHVYNASREHRIIHQKMKRKEYNRKAHSKKGTVEIVPAKLKSVIKEDE
ncbi:DDB1- and CUL4-associated factor 13 [Neocloeon triangulifer]|uniref:DDB1- and CUL4-associated factor 13 n=1 Tax=Neocloeon triangulifer TaxID=2078957 RepID=UPI00286F12E5|nr:DDB1- and CUL4-associated factor 13 [Neocloeon triangulifer]